MIMILINLFKGTIPGTSSMLKRLCAISLFGMSAISTGHAATIDFESFVPGDILTNQTFSGVTFSVANQGNTGGVPRELMIYDAACGGSTATCSGEDPDLYFPQYGNILIISEDNDSSDPDDSRFGGDIYLDFMNSVVSLSSIVLDVEDGPGDNFVSAFLNGIEVASIVVSSPNNGLAIADFGSQIIADQLLIHFEGSGAIAEVSYTPVPIPAALPLFVAGLIGLMGLRRRFA